MKKRRPMKRSKRRRGWRTVPTDYFRRFPNLTQLWDDETKGREAFFRRYFT